MLIPRQKLCLIGFCFALCAHAQQNRGTIFGTVTDTSGATMPGTRITVTDITTNAVFTTESNQAGFYSAPGLAVGEYQVAGERPGFKKAVRSGITLQVDQRAEVNLTMDLGAVAESVEVVGQAPLVDTGGATVGEVIDNRRVLELPVNGRNALSLVFLMKSNAGTTNSGFAERGPNLSALSINGGANSMNEMLLDGASNIQPYQGEVNVNVAVDAVQEQARRTACR